MSNTFRCQTCGARASAKGYHFYSIVYGFLVVALMVSGVLVSQFIFGEDFRFEYLLVAVALVVIVVMWMFSAHYWRLVLRWIEIT